MLSSERGDANIIEYAIVFPICMMVFFFLFMIGFMLNQNALLESAAERGILIAQKAFTDPNAAKMMSFGPMTEASSSGFSKLESPNYSGFKNDPYRFLNKNYNGNTIKKNVESTVEAIVRKNQFLGAALLGEPKATYKTGDGFLDRDVFVTVEQEFKPLKLLINIVGLPGGTYTLKGKAKLKISSQTEFLRNTDFVLDMAVRFGISKYAEKIAGFFDKITNFFNKT